MSYLTDHYLLCYHKLMLSQRQENFCLNIVSGMNQTQAALKAGYSPLFLDTNANKILKSTRIAARLEELRVPAVNSTKMLVAEREDRLSVIGREDLISDKGTLLRAHNITAIQELNKMDGSYAPAKTDHTFNGEGLSEVLQKLRGYNPKQLEQE